jgi:hypothetical protein
MVEVPIQVLEMKKVWNKQDFQFTKGVLNSSGKNINNRVGSVRGIQRGGFGHTNPAWPVVHEDQLYWQGGAGVLYRVDLSGKFSPERISWTSIDSKGEHWTFGEPAVTDDAVYVRSQRDLVRLKWN